jgi:hypothetical protein
VNWASEKIEDILMKSFYSSVEGFPGPLKRPYDALKLV